MALPPKRAGSVVLTADSNVVNLAKTASMLVPFVGIFAWIAVNAKVALVVMAIATLVLVIASAESLRAAMLWHTPELESPSAALALGSQFVVVYRRRPKRVRDVSECKVFFRLVCEERATYRQGSNSTTETAEVVVQELTSDGFGTEKGVEAHAAFRIPVDAGAPSFDLGNNEVCWFVQVWVVGQGLPRDKHKFELRVIPELAADLERPQDS